MRALSLVALLLLASQSQAGFVLTQIRLSWPLDQSGNAFRLSTSDFAYLEFDTTPNTLSLNFDVTADANANVAALVADMRDGLADTLTLSVGSYSNAAPEAWFFGELDAVDGTGLRRLDYASQYWPALATGVDWSNFPIDSFHVSAVGPISATLPDRARVVIDVVVGRIPEPSTLLLLSMVIWWPLRRRWRPRGR